MSTEENSISGISTLSHLNKDELNAYNYLASFKENEALAFYFTDGHLTKIADPQLENAISVLFPNLNSYTDISDLGTLELLSIIEARNFGQHPRDPKPTLMNSLNDSSEGSIEPIIDSAAAANALTKNTENRHLLNGLYVEREPNIFYRLDSDKPALIDEGMKLKVINKDLETFKAAIELAEAKGWVGIQVNGSDKFKAEAWYQASIKGLSVRGYEPNDEDKKRLLEFQLEKKVELSADDKKIISASYQSAQDYALERNAGVVYPNQSNETRNFSGRVVKVFDSHVVQDIGRNTMAVHEKSRVGDIETDTKLNIQYNGRSASVKEVQKKTSSLQH